MKKKKKSEWVRKTPLHLEKKDKRYKLAVKQLKERGFSDSETWSLDETIRQFVLPRLMRFREINNGHPGGLTQKKWDSILDDMISAFSVPVWEVNSEEEQKLDKGLKLFAEWFAHLWW